MTYRKKPVVREVYHSPYTIESFDDYKGFDHILLETEEREFEAPHE